MTKSSRISLIHATPLAIAPIAESFKRLWPEASVFNILEDSLTADLKAADGNIAALTTRFVALTRYAVDSGADGVLFTCSAFGPAIDAARAEVSVPVLKPNEAMIAQALARGSKIALMATFAPSIAPITAEFEAAARQASKTIDLRSFCVPEAWTALQQGDAGTHDRLIAEASAQAADCDVICFAQFSMTSAAPATQTSSGRPVLTTPDSAVTKLKEILTARNH
ncbi:aspartate/glutamate racemase family protein [Burkholderia sp. S171]|uniref:aspartate/glutamate racemase family protein n=1 Tax=Burkholderia sp. S171 TaxID=1641860 RepID=UPI00131B622D|nr:aspartate/glutamate racemase family protein [Burkholderia sp. S171]